MPRYPDLDPMTHELGGSVFSQLASRIRHHEGDLYPLHIGDTWLPPAVDLTWNDVAPGLDPAPHRYSEPRGIAPLREAIYRKVAINNRIKLASANDVVVCAGATAALAAAAHAVLAPGDELMILAPHWPLIRGITISAQAVPVTVPVLHEELTPEKLTDALRARLTSKTAAVYVSTPCNPTGGVIDQTCLEAVAEFASDNNLWIFSDEVYEDYQYEGEHVSIGSIAPERTLSAFSFSKAYGMTGYRCGYLVGPTDAMNAVRKVVTYLWYSAPTPAQYLAVEALKNADAWIASTREAYADVGRETARRLGIAGPKGGTFLFVDVADRLDDRGLLGFLEDCLDEDGLLLAPGESFGEDFGTYVRVCFTCMEPEKTLRAADALARRLGR
ncbi:MAG: pyridoxal phosphate-dependent aminotransferase [Deltaproteobacteria bacterium]|nr:pyridoxal phosphate-dependent aminotransferase [Deltaproteobacteria bacterium]